MAQHADQRAAIDQYDQLILSKAAAHRVLRGKAKDLRNRARMESDPGSRDKLVQQAASLAIAASRLSQENLRLLHARNRILKSQSLTHLLAEMRTIAASAREAVEQMKSVAQALKAVETLINIARRFAGLIV